MAPSIESFSKDANATEIVAALDRDGAAIVREVVAPQTMDDLLELVTPDLETSFERIEAAGGEYFGHRSKPLFGLFGRGREFSEELLLHPLLGPVADAVLGPNGDHYRVNVGGVMQVWEGGEEQPLHREMDRARSGVRILIVIREWISRLDERKNCARGLFESAALGRIDR